jgi:putative methionine-R-sulfoxide reductase with GAF domain
MDTYSILDKKLPQAAHKTASSGPALSNSSPASGAGAATAMAREALPFPGEDGGKSLTEMAQRDLDATLQLLAERAQYITGASGAAIALRDGENMVCCASAGATAPALGAHLQTDSGLSAESVRTRKILHCDDAETDPRVNQESCRALGIASVVVMPLVRDGEVYGVFELLAGRPAAFEERDFIALHRLSEMIQTAVEHSEAARRAEKLGSQPETEITLAVEAESGTASEKQALVQGPVENHIEPKDSASNLAQAKTVQTKPVETKPAEAKIADAQPTDVTAAESKIAHTNLAEIILDEENTGPIVPLAFGKVRNCQGCGFPISEGRRLCLDCEAASPNVDSGTEESQPFGQPSESEPSWFRSHLYLVATIVIVVATIALLVWRF